MNEKTTTRASSVDLHYLASFLDGYNREFLDEIAEHKDYARIAQARKVSTRHIKNKSKELVAVAYEIMWECIYGKSDTWALGIYAIIETQNRINNKLFLDEVKAEVRGYDI